MSRLCIHVSISVMPDMQIYGSGSGNISLSEDLQVENADFATISDIFARFHSIGLAIKELDKGGDA